MLNVYWRECRTAARQGTLQHKQLLQLLEAAAAQKRWDRIQVWILPLLLHAITDGEREGSAIACADWLLQQQHPNLAKDCLELVNWPTADADAWYLRSCVAQSLGLTQEAQQHLIRTLAVPGGLAIVTYRLGQLHRSRGDFDQAAAWFLASLRCNPEPFHIHIELQFTRCSNSLLPELIDFYVQLCDQQPDRTQPRQFLAHYLLKQGRMKESIHESCQAARLGLGPLSEQLDNKKAAPTPPDFVIIGVPKGGTTSLIHWLNHCPYLWCHPRKELSFFDENFELGEEWYCAQFPRFKADAKVLRGEATPNYFSHLQTPERFAKLIPNGRAILLLRDPVQRALSWIRHLQRLEGLVGSLDHWLTLELDQLETLSSEELLHHPRIGTGALQDSCYDVHLHNWQKHIDVSKQMLVLSSESMFQAPASQLQRVLSFLNQPDDPSPWMDEWRAVNVNPGVPEQATTGLLKRLEEFLYRQCHESMAISKMNDRRNPVHY